MTKQYVKPNIGITSEIVYYVPESGGVVTVDPAKSPGSWIKHIAVMQESGGPYAPRYIELPESAPYVEGLEDLLTGETAESIDESSAAYGSSFSGPSFVGGFTEVPLAPRTETKPEPKPGSVY